MGLADEASAGIEQRLDRRRRRGARLALLALQGMAAAGRIADDVEEVLHAHGEAGERPRRRMVDLDILVVDEGVDGILDESHAASP